ncbi:MAG: HEAT repeat domain-containing protein [Armatimonadota bacterium]
MRSLRDVGWATLLVAVILLASGALAQGQPPLRALIVDGQNNHAWKDTTPVLQTILEASDRFEVAVATSPPKGKPMADFVPEFAAYDVIVLNYNGDAWPEATRKAFVEYVQAGGGVVVFHAADNSFPNWQEYNEIIGLGGWGGRNETAGPMLRYRDRGIVLDESPGRAGSHPPKHDFQVIIRDPEHPITRGLPTRWMHANDEIYGRLRGPAKNLTLLATAYSDPERRSGSGEHEPVLFTISYGAGRIFHTVLGHGPDQMRSVGFLVTLQRGTEWAATGDVTLTGVPVDFPSAEVVSVRPLDRLAEAVPPRRDPGWPDVHDVADAYAALPSYDFDRQRLPLSMIEDAIRGASPAELSDVETRLLDVLQMPEATRAAREFVCRMLREIGSPRSVPALAPLLTDEELSHMARFALEAMAAPEAGRALREALSEATGPAKIGIVASLGQRRDREARDALVALADADDPALQEAAIIALGKIGGARAAAALAALAPREGLTLLVNDAQIQCAEAMRADGNRAGALAMYGELLRPSYPTPTRIGAARGIALTEGERAAPTLIALLSDDDGAVRQVAGELLAATPGMAVTRVLADLVPTLPPRAQVAVLDALAVRGDRAAAPRVAEAAASEDADVRAAALRALGVLGGAQHIALLLRASVTEDAAGAAARDSLSQLATADVCAALIDALATEEHTVARATAVEVLGRIGGPTALEALRHQLRVGEAQVQEAAISALGHWPDAAPMPDLLDIVRATDEPALRASAFRAYLNLATLSGAGDEQGRIATLQEAVRLAPGPDERKLVFDQLADIGSDRALEAVRGFLDHPQIASEAKAAHRKIARRLGLPVPLEDKVVLQAKDAAIQGNGAAYERAANRDCIGVWRDVGTWVSWRVEVQRPGAFDVEISQSMQGHAGAKYTVEIAGQQLEGVVVETGDWGDFRAQQLGHVTIAEPGVYTVAFKPTSKTKQYVINLRSVTLQRSGGDTSPNP